MNCECPSYIATGSQVGKLQNGPWTPYAQAIADHYAIQIPLFMTIPTNFSGVALQRRTVLSEPLQYDALIFGALINGGDDTENARSIFLNVADNKSGVYWSSPATLESSPLIAYGSLADEPLVNYPTSIVRLPEAFFLPANVELRHEWSQPTGQNATGGYITWIGLQLINPFAKKAPEFVRMPNGEKVRVGSRIPWITTLGIGARSYIAGVQAFRWNGDRSVIDYTPPVECGLEIHDLICSTFDEAAESLDPDDQLTKLAISKNREMWTPDLSPFTAVFGDVQQVYPALPLPKPIKLEKNERIQFRFQNNTENDIDNGMVIIRGVQLCEY
jgi:hypothetical protein